MTESMFIRKMHVLFDHLVDIYYDGEEINEDITAIEKLCKNFLTEKKKKEKTKQWGAGHA